MSRVVGAPRAEPLTGLGPVAQLTAGRLPERLLRLVAGLALYGLSIALMIEGSVGASPWDVFHSGVARHVPVSLGTVLTAASVCVLLAWIPLRQIPGVGTVANTLLLGPLADVSLWLLPAPEALVPRVTYMLAGVVLCALGTALYVGAQLGPGPRDGLMTGLVRRTGRSVRSVRTAIEVSVLLAGVALGASAGPGTVVFALAVGPLTQIMLGYLVVDLRSSDERLPLAEPCAAGKRGCP
ncbi:membrane protein YczE [Gordonia rhizosphera]|uniref:Membrane protein YczE n=1 Tax=Gordonia rhizosphera NBRC 16068 TaxID=1108045 RepID=K6W6S7_9ACTN|nr:membrane protein [Gordonia rhizosphera]GAB89421.1 hypothetical protein GORHZ_061_00040 [Gordonia rhizosphera NBRC 16068]